MSRYAIRDGEVVVNRIFPFSMRQELVTVSRTEVACLTITQPGLFNTLAWPSKSTTDPQDDAIEVEVYVSGLNFRWLVRALSELVRFVKGQITHVRVRHTFAPSREHKVRVTAHQAAERLGHPGKNVTVLGQGVPLANADARTSVER
ncbi:type I iterative PKS [Apiospora saccharicola]